MKFAVSASENDTTRSQVRNFGRVGDQATSNVSTAVHVKGTRDSCTSTNLQGCGISERDGRNTGDVDCGEVCTGTTAQHVVLDLGGSDLAVGTACTVVNQEEISVCQISTNCSCTIQVDGSNVNSNGRGESRSTQDLSVVDLQDLAGSEVQVLRRTEVVTQCFKVESLVTITRVNSETSTVGSGIVSSTLSNFDCQVSNRNRGGVNLSRGALDLQVTQDEHRAAVVVQSSRVKGDRRRTSDRVAGNDDCRTSSTSSELSSRGNTSSVDATGNTEIVVAVGQTSVITQFTTSTCQNHTTIGQVLNSSRSKSCSTGSSDVCSLDSARCSNTTSNTQV